MKCKILSALCIVGIFVPAIAFAETHLIVSYDEAYQGTVSVNGQPIGTLISLGTYNEVSDTYKATKERGEKLDKDVIFQEKTGANKAGLKGVGSNLMMNFEVNYILDKHLRNGDNTVSIAFTGYKNPEAERFAYKGRRLNGPNRLDAKLWEVNGENINLTDYKVHVVKPSAESKVGTDLTQTSQTLDFVVKK